jgi:Spy/CpxP family protein refolding chaperone
MKYAKLLLLLIVAITAMSGAALGQDGPPPDDPPPGDRQDDRRPNLLAELGLSPEQVQQIRKMNQERRPLMMRAQRRMREANRDLDIAIYADNFSDADFQARLKEFQAAQADMARLRFESEMSVRKVLTAEQIVKFRQLRAEFAPRRRDNMQNRRDQRREGRGLAPRQGDPPPGRRPIQ